ncbi:MAG: hypothetical protein GF307_12570 [candidate division Zixibacteria bacterium]|nr:hypothetical protein [candidate division Zixibacteria bacterium]
MKNILSFIKKELLASGSKNRSRVIPPRSKGGKRRSKVSFDGNNLLFEGNDVANRQFKIKFYRFLRDNIPTISSAVWTWARLCNAPRQRSYSDDLTGSMESEINDILTSLERRIFPFRFWKYGGFDALLDTFFNGLFTDGAVCGELVLNPSGNSIEGFYPVDVAELEFEHMRGQWNIFQNRGESRIKLPRYTLFYYGLDAEASDPRGKSIISAVPFVSRIEQQLVEDMSRSVHNAGYHRLQIAITPPEKRPGESDDAYVNRANEYFDDTARMMNELDTDDNPITWDDIEIKHVGPSNYSSIGAWYLNHKAIIEDICCGCHLDPFMLGYSYGTTHNWAKFKYEIVLRHVYSIQAAAAHLIDWLCDIELALKGFPLRVRHYFDNGKSFGMEEQRRAEQTHINNVVTMLNNGLITDERARNLLEV